MNTRLLACLALGLSTACTYDNGEPNYLIANSPDCGPAQEASIDTNAALSVDPGQGAGAFVEYAAGGHYHVRTACDTLRNGSVCNWDLVLTTDSGSIVNLSPESLEPGDSATVLGAGANSIHLLATTDTDLDGITFDATVPGAALKVDALLDNYCAPSYIFWTGGGAVHASPSSIVWLTPSAP